MIFKAMLNFLKDSHIVRTCNKLLRNSRWSEDLHKISNWCITSWKKHFSRKPLIAGVMCSILVLCTGAAIYSAASIREPLADMKQNLVEAYSVYYQGRKIAIVQDKQQLYSAVRNILQEFEERYDMEVVLKGRIYFDEVLAESPLLCRIEEIEKAIRNNTAVEVKGVVLKINEEEVACLKDWDTVKRLLDRLQEPYRKVAIDAGYKLEEIGFDEDISLESRYMDYNKIQDPEKVFEWLTGETQEKEIYVVQEGDSLWTIARKYEIRVEDIRNANAFLGDKDTIQIGTELNLTVPETPVHVVTQEKIQYSETIDYETEVRKSDSMYTTQTKVSQEGKKGEREVVARVTKRNGIEKAREILSQTVLREPVKKIVVKGTKKPPSNVVASRGSGSMIWPTRGTITSNFGRRWGRLHKGIDIANRKGTPIYAADSGVVTFSGRSGGYGNLVKISHGGGLLTYYGHLSSRSVSVGQNVKRGQLIGYMGSTGNSTGSHLHFEVRVNGTAVNPRRYLK